MRVGCKRRPGPSQIVGGGQYRRSMRLAELTQSNLQSSISLALKPGQEKFVDPVVNSIAEAFVTPTAWPRVVMDDDDVLGFIMGNFDPVNEVAAFRAGVWRLNVAGSAQGRGVGRFAVNALASEARRRGLASITTMWEQGDGGPEGFYLRLGFVQTGEIIFGESVGVLAL